MAGSLCHDNCELGSHRTNHRLIASDVNQAKSCPLCEHINPALRAATCYYLNNLSSDGQTCASSVCVEIWLLAPNWSSPQARAKKKSISSTIRVACCCCCCRCSCLSLVDGLVCTLELLCLFITSILELCDYLDHQIHSYRMTFSHY